MTWYKKAMFQSQIEGLIPANQLKKYRTLKAKYNELSSLYVDYVTKSGSDSEYVDKYRVVLQKMKELEKKIDAIESGPKKELAKRHQEALNEREREEAITKERFTNIKSIRDKLESHARRYFPLTSDIRLCGYILSNGDMLRFSYQGNIRDIDHRYIIEAFPDDTPIDSGTNGMRQFMIATGAMRVSCVSKDIWVDLETDATDAQKSILRKYKQRGFDISVTKNGNQVDLEEFLYS